MITDETIEGLGDEIIGRAMSGILAAEEESHLEGAYAGALSESDGTRELDATVDVSAAKYTCKEKSRTSQRWRYRDGR